MKTKYFNHATLLIVALTLMSWSSGYLLADDHHDAWSHDKSGYWDDHGRHQTYVEHNHHQGYWRTHDNGTKFFINID